MTQEKPEAEPRFQVEDKSTAPRGQDANTAEEKTPPVEGVATASPDNSKPAKGESSDDAPAPSEKQKRRIIRLSIAAVGFVAGSIFGAYAEELIARANPGFFGPDNQKIIDEQAANFANLDAKLKELELNAAEDPKMLALLGQLGEMVEEQKSLATRKDEMFKATDIERQVLDDKLLQATEVSGTVDFWLKPGESIVLVDPDKVFALVNHYTAIGDVNVSLSGQQHRISVGDRVDFETTNGPRVVIFRHVKRESDGRYGFDLARPGEMGEK